MTWYYCGITSLSMETASRPSVSLAHLKINAWRKLISYKIRNLIRNLVFNWMFSHPSDTTFPLGVGVRSLNAIQISPTWKRHAMTGVDNLRTSVKGILKSSAYHVRIMILCEYQWCCISMENCLREGIDVMFTTRQCARMLPLA